MIVVIAICCLVGSWTSVSQNQAGVKHRSSSQQLSPQTRSASIKTYHEITPVSLIRGYHRLQIASPVTCQDTHLNHLGGKTPSQETIWQNRYRIPMPLLPVCCSAASFSILMTVCAACLPRHERQYFPKRTTLWLCRWRGEPSSQPVTIKHSRRWKSRDVPAASALRRNIRVGGLTQLSAMSR